MTGSVALAGWTVLAYLLGSIPFGVLFARLRGVNVRTAGSGNIGATNVARTVGKKLGLVVLVLDAGKGAAPLFALYHLHLPGVSAADPVAIVAIGLAPILGHCFSPWLRLRGGKGVATSLGVTLVADASLAGVAVVVFALVYALGRVVSVASLSASVALAALFWVLSPHPEAVLMTLAALVIVVQHRDNLRRLRAGTELGLSSKR